MKRPEHDLVVEWVPYEQLQQHPENANNGDVDLIQQSILVNGMYGPVTAQRSTGYIVKGNHTYLAAVKRGLKKIPVIYLDISDMEARRIMVADNRTARSGHDDEGQLANLLESLHGTDAGLAGTGYDFQDYSALMELVNSPVTADDFHEPDEEPIQPLVLGHLNFTVMPVVDPEGKVYEFVLSRPNYKHLTANDLNIIRSRLGQEPLSNFQLASYDVPDWKV